ncbi:glycerophosphodiester phosphodiesterase family protein [Chryseolinea sp. T2]|uniref:glycerophosphodiester phosphodiesterase family protein n=1 Tax=Chryseolinea sp. T2 TaxID=3129255 RepID=UPI0030775F69
MKTLRYHAVILVTALTLCAAMPQRTSGQSKKLIVIAHRGDHTTAPENTLKAFSDAIATGVDYVEVDVRASSDGELVVMHDATIDRMTTSHGKLSDLKWSDIKQLMVSDKKHPEFGNHKVPLFAEVLKICKGKIGIYLDFKDGDIEKAWRLIQEFDMENRVVVYLNKEEQLQGWRSHAPAVPLMASLPDTVKNINSYLNFQKLVNVQIVDGDHSDYTADLVRGINKNGQSIWVDVQEPDENEALWTKVLSLGVQGMQTDHPRELVRWRSSLK